MIKVKTVQPGCLGQELGLEQGFELLALDGRELTDFLDWEFGAAQIAATFASLTGIRLASERHSTFVMTTIGYRSVMGTLRRSPI
jgi:hypothetical protein